MMLGGAAFWGQQNRNVKQKTNFWFLLLRCVQKQNSLFSTCASTCFNQICYPKLLKESNFLFSTAGV